MRKNACTVTRYSYLAEVSEPEWAARANARLRDKTRPRSGKESADIKRVRARRQADFWSVSSSREAMRSPLSRDPIEVASPTMIGKQIQSI